MFCSECGAKNPDGAAFCQECGAKLDVTEPEKEKTKKEEKVVTSKPSIKMTKKQKSLVVLIAIVVIVLFVLYQIISTKVSPATIVKNYISAIGNKDYHKLYELAEFSGDTTFITEEAFKEELKENLGDATIQNFTVGKNVKYGNLGLTATVPVNITVSNKTSSNTEELTVELSKMQDKKFLFFDNWKINDMASILGYDIINDFEIRVPKDTKVTFEGIKLDPKYLDNDSDEKNTNVDVYQLPQVLKTDSAKLEFEIFGNIKITKEIAISAYYSQYTLNITKDDLDDKEQEKMTTAIKENITTLMNALIAKKSFAEIQNTFNAVDSSDLDDIKKLYDNQIDYINKLNYTISNFSIEDIEIATLSVDSDFTIFTRINVDYKWKATSTTNGNTRDVDDSYYVAYELVYKDGGYKISNVSGMPSLYVYMY